MISRSRDLAALALLVLTTACIASPTTAGAKDGRREGEVSIEYASPKLACAADGTWHPQRKYWCLALRVTNKTSTAFTLATDPLSSPPKKLLIIYWFQYLGAEPGSEWEGSQDADGVSLLQYTRVAPGESVEVHIHFPGARMPMGAHQAAARVAIPTIEGETLYSDPFPETLLSRRN